MTSPSINAEILRLKNAANLLNGYVMFSLIIIGTIGNVLNLIIFIRMKSFRQLSNSVFLLTFFLSNLISLWSSRFQRCFLTITGVDLLVGSIVYCKIRWLFGRWGFNMSFTCLCLSSIDRFLNTSRNQRFRRLCTLKRTSTITILIGFIYLIIFMPDAIYYSGYQCTASSSDRAIYGQFITYFNIIISDSLPVVILGIFCLLTWYNLHVTQNIRRNNYLQQQVNRMMIIEFNMIFISSLPNFIFNIYSQVTQSVVKSDLRTAQENLWKNVGVTLSLFLNVGTFYIYIAASPIFRRNLLVSLCWKKSNQIASQHATKAY